MNHNLQRSIAIPRDKDIVVSQFICVELIKHHEVTSQNTAYLNAGVEYMVFYPKLYHRNISIANPWYFIVGDGLKMQNSLNNFEHSKVCL